jgi:ectoine hydroxylase-related dioxygenase (phytanoyl-CoA dioxygenase family)
MTTILKTATEAGAYRPLNASERQTYDDLGFVVVPDVMPADELERIDREIDRLLGQLAAERRARGEALGGASHPGEDTGSVGQLGLRSPVCRQFAEDPRVLSLIEDIVQPGIGIFSVKMIAKQPFSDMPCHWHQDDAYFLKSSGSNTRMSVWVPLQDAHERNGCLYVVPESHKWGLQGHHKKDYGQCRIALNEAENQEILDKKAVAVPVSAGSAVLFSALTWHGSKGNQTETVRRAFITTYQEATVPRGNALAAHDDQWMIVRPAN